MFTKYTPIVTRQEKKLPFYIATIGNPKKQHVVHRPLGIEDHQLLYVVKGKGGCYINGETYILGSDSIFYLPPNTPHEYFVIQPDWETIFITFNGCGCSNFFNFEPVVCKNISSKVDFVNKYKVLYEYKGNPMNCKKQSAELYMLLLELSDVFAEPAKSDNDKIHKITLAMSYLSRTNNNDLSPLVKQLGISEEHFCRIFKKYTDYRPVEYSNLIRVQKAKILLRNSEKSVKEICEELGFQNHSYFTTVFKKYVGVSPSLYKKIPDIN